MNSRNNNIDIAKGIGIILVVLGHNWLITHDKDGFLFRAIYSFHMPLFFFLAGIFLKETQAFKEFSLSKVDALLKPYLVVLGVLGMLKVATGHASPFRYFFCMLYGVGSTIEWVQLWFLPTLFL